MTLLNSINGVNVINAHYAWGDPYYCKLNLENGETVTITTEEEFEILKQKEEALIAERKEKERLEWIEQERNRPIEFGQYVMYVGYEDGPSNVFTMNIEKDEIVTKNSIIAELELEYDKKVSSIDLVPFSEMWD